MLFSFSRLPGGFTVHVGPWRFGVVLHRALGVLYLTRSTPLHAVWELQLWPSRRP